jgi:hypothetical protein
MFMSRGRRDVAGLPIMDWGEEHSTANKERRTLSVCAWLVRVFRWVFAGIAGRGEEHSTASKERRTLSVCEWLVRVFRGCSAFRGERRRTLNSEQGTPNAQRFVPVFRWVFGVS